MKPVHADALQTWTRCPLAKDAFASLLEESPSHVQRPLLVPVFENACASSWQELIATNCSRLYVLFSSENPLRFDLCHPAASPFGVATDTANQPAPHSRNLRTGSSASGARSVGQCMLQLKFVKRRAKDFVLSLM